VIEEEGRIYCDGLNIAARLKFLAEPAGIYVSKTAFNHIRFLAGRFTHERTEINAPTPDGGYGGGKGSSNYGSFVKESNRGINHKLYDQFVTPGT